MFLGVDRKNKKRSAPMEPPQGEIHEVSLFFLRIVPPVLVDRVRFGSPE